MKSDQMFIEISRRTTRDAPLRSQRVEQAACQIEQLAFLENIAPKYRTGVAVFDRRNPAFGTARSRDWDADA
jgi:hypothetical protein